MMWPSFDESKLIPLTAGSFYTEPAGVPHFIMIKDEGVVVKVTGTGQQARTCAAEVNSATSHAPALRRWKGGKDRHDQHERHCDDVTVVSVISNDLLVANKASVKAAATLTEQVG